MRSADPDGVESASLFDAIAAGDLSMVEDLLAAGADPDVVDGHAGRSTALAWACGHGDEGAVRTLLRSGAKPDAVADARPLVEAARHGFVDLMVLLIKAGARPDAADRSGVTALLLAAANGFADIARKLVEAGADRAQAGPDGALPADAARAAGHAMLAAYLDDPAGVSARHALWRDGREAARAVADARRTRVINRALGLDDDLQAPEWTFSGGIAHGPAVTQDFTSVAASGNTALVIRMLDAGLDPDWTLCGGATALMMAARSGEREVLEVLLERGADPDRRNDTGLTALHFALFKPSARVHGPVVARLLAAGADPDAVDGEGLRPLHRACGHGVAEIAAALVDAGADPFLPDRTGRTPADLAPAGGRKGKAIQELLDRVRARR